jgi:hypothetical protein
VILQKCASKLIGKMSGSVYRRISLTLTDATWEKAVFDPINAKQYDMMKGGLTPSGEGEMWCFIEKVARATGFGYSQVTSTFNHERFRIYFQILGKQISKAIISTIGLLEKGLPQDKLPPSPKLRLP